jgi:site-specific DNA-cytosine methylase
MNILSCFDGMACGRVALERAGIPVTSYHAYEIDKYAIQIATKNYPDIVSLGDVNNWCNHVDRIPVPDIILAGSPCQGFSNAGTRQNFDDPRSRLFFVFVDILKYYRSINPNVKFLLENVKMKQEWQDIISGHLGVSPVMIDSALVSAQSRKRLYWANFTITQPEDKGIYLRDIVLSDAYPVVLHNVYGGFGEKENRVFTEKSPTIRTAAGGGHIPHVLKGAAFRNQVTKRGIESQLNIRNDDKSNCVVPSYPHKLNCVVDIEALIHSPQALEYMNRQVSDGRTHWDFEHHSDIRNTKSAAVVANFFKGVPYNVMKDWNCIRKFHPIECERLQTLPDNYTEGVSATQRYRMIGNGWTVDVIAHILKNLAP